MRPIKLKMQAFGAYVEPITIDFNKELENICNKIDYLYRNLGQKPNKVKGNELLIVCKEV